MFTLIVLATMTSIGTYPSKARCEAAIRQIYSQKMDPYNYMDPVEKTKILTIQMKYSAPREYICAKT